MIITYYLLVLIIIYDDYYDILFRACSSWWDLRELHALGVRFENRMDNAGAAIVECKDGSPLAHRAGPPSPNVGDVSRLRAHSG